MKYQVLAKAYQNIENTASRLAMIELLVELIKQVPKELISKMMYLTQGKIYPDFEGIEIGMAEKMAAKTIAHGSGLTAEQVWKNFEKIGDLGEAANKIFTEINHKGTGDLKVVEVWEVLDKIARTKGAGTVEKRINLLDSIIQKASPLEAKYLIRTATGKIRLGVADMTLLDALAIVFLGEKKKRQVLEGAYNNTSDLGLVAETVATKGETAVKNLNVVVGKPLRPMLTERASTAQDILEKIGGEAAVEYKYDGERVQIHKNGNSATLFSRRLENTTHQYPDVIELALKNIKAESAILDTETVAFDTASGDLLPFQELMHRRRKHGVEKAVTEYPICVFAFDLLFLNGQDLTKKSYLERKKLLESVVVPQDNFKVGEYIVTRDPEKLDWFFEKALTDGVEGIVAKSTAKESVYQAGNRGWLWIKYKKDYKAEMTDSVDLVVVGAIFGRGRRAGKYGALLLAGYDKKTDTFKTITKNGSGFTDEDLEKLPKLLEQYKISHKHPRVESDFKADIWFTPGIVLEIIGAELTLSPIHRIAFDKIRKGAGLAIRFPRFTGNIRADKAPEDATTEEEFVEMYNQQLNIAGNKKL